MANMIQDRIPHYRMLPVWFRQSLPDSQKIKMMQSMFRGRNVSTVCESARCPNMGQCWGRGVATFMILGDVCTRVCRFCAVETGAPSGVDPHEPENIADMVFRLGLRYVVVTSVTRDDLLDEGADQFVSVVRALRKKNPDIKIELLVPDFSGRKDLLHQVIDAGPDVLGHNIEMARRVFSAIRPQANYDRSLDVLCEIRKANPDILVKSGLMVGLGETDEDVEEVMVDLRDAGCDLLTIGQYLAPSGSQRHAPVDRFVDPETFEEYRRKGMSLGFRHVFSSPLVRSSYIAEEGYRACCQEREAAA